MASYFLFYNFFNFKFEELQVLRWFILLFLLFFNVEAKIPKDTLIVAVENEISRINPAYSEDHDAVINLVFSGLTRFDEHMSLKPDLAASWNVSKDGLSYDIFLREDVLWHDGVVVPMMLNSVLKLLKILKIILQFM